MPSKDSRGTCEPPRVGATRMLQAAIAFLDGAGLLDQRARDRVLTAALGTLKRELNRARQERDSQQLPLERVA